MATIIGQSTDPNQPGVLGEPLTSNLPANLPPGSLAIGVKGDGGSGVPGPTVGPVTVPGRLGIGVQGTSSDPHGFGVQGINTAGGEAGNFSGNVVVTGNMSVSGTLNMTGANSDIIITGGDCAEDFDIGLSTDLEPGTVMALDEHGLLQESRHAYDKKVAGVISGAGEFKSGLILGRPKVQGDCRRASVALIGKVYCKVYAQDAPIEIGDLLTTSATPGHAMKAGDPIRAFGAVIGKALRSMSAGQRGLIPILVALQ
jgi:hypothetical protein